LFQFTLLAGPGPPPRGFGKGLLPGLAPAGGALGGGEEGKEGREESSLFNDRTGDDTVVDPVGGDVGLVNFVGGVVEAKTPLDSSRRILRDGPEATGDDLEGEGFGGGLVRLGAGGPTGVERVGGGAAVFTKKIIRTSMQ
jgi:hypothetical protein